MSEQREIAAILEKQHGLRDERALLVGISGIDAAGKGFVAARLAEAVQAHGLKVALVNVDGWLNLPSVRFGSSDPARHFYEHGVRFEAMFAQLIGPLVRDRSIEVEADFAEETAGLYRKHHYEFGDIDVVLLEGIFLFKREHRDRLDLAVWIECSFETALRRAVARGQEGLPPAETIHAFETIYFPAQRLHFQRDDPHGFADLVVSNEAVH